MLKVDNITSLWGFVVPNMISESCPQAMIKGRLFEGSIDLRGGSMEGEAV